MLLKNSDILLLEDLLDQIILYGFAGKISDMRYSI